MGFAVYKTGGQGVPPSRGTAAICSNGRALLNAEDMRDIGISDAATLLIDRERKQVGIRATRPGECPRVVKRAARSKCGDIWVSGALLEIGVRPGDVAGLREVSIRDGVIVFDFSESECES